MAAFTSTLVRLNSNPRSPSLKPLTLDARWQNEFCLTESCRTFISRLKNLYESIEGKEDKQGNPNKSAIEDTLRQKVEKMRDETLIKILLQGMLPKFKAELYLRMPEDLNDFEALCKQLIISEQILQNKKKEVARIKN
jgi:hypothetical protein